MMDPEEGCAKVIKVQKNKDVCGELHRINCKNQATTREAHSTSQ